MSASVVLFQTLKKKKGRKKKEPKVRRKLNQQELQKFFFLRFCLLLSIERYLVINYSAPRRIFCLPKASNNKIHFSIVLSLNSAQRKPASTTFIFYHKPYLHICLIQLETRKWENFQFILLLSFAREIY